MEKHHCPHCGSDDVLPHESEDDYTDDHSFWIILASAVLLAAGYFLIMISSYIYFPAAIFIFIIIAAWTINRSESKRRSAQLIERDYVCLECSRNFKAEDKVF